MEGRENGYEQTTLAAAGTLPTRHRLIRRQASFEDDAVGPAVPSIPVLGKRHDATRTDVSRDAPDTNDTPDGRDVVRVGPTVDEVLAGVPDIRRFIASTACLKLAGPTNEVRIAGARYELRCFAFCVPGANVRGDGSDSRPADATFGAFVCRHGIGAHRLLPCTYLSFMPTCYCYVLHDEASAYVSIVLRPL